MKQLILLRHGEAQAQRPGLADFDRSLTDHGRTEALDAADCLRRIAVRIDALIASPARRAKETALIIAARLDFNHTLLFDPFLYREDMQALLESAQRCEADARAVLLVAHNPGISLLARHLADSLPVIREASAGSTDGQQNLPDGSSAPLSLTTAGICRIQFDAASWTELAPQTVKAVSLMR
jgi:phosphohistidine phosphatase